MISSLSTSHGDLRLPAFLPDATRGVVRGVDARDLTETGVEAVMVNTLHLSSQPGTSTVKDVGGAHAFMGWDGPVASDSGGFQVMSLAAGGPRGVSVEEGGLSYKLEGQRKRRSLTPETCIRYQVQLEADILFCLDHCPPAGADASIQRESVEHTVKWAAECKTEFEKRVQSAECGVRSAEGEGSRPLLFAIVQGGEDRGLREECIQRLVEIGFDGYGFGGWPIADDGGLVDAVGWVAESLPDDTPIHGLGIGKPENVIAAERLGVHTFDCTIPTRDSRRGRLYEATDTSFSGGYAYLFIEKERFTRDNEPVDASCDCWSCTRYSRAYLHHLFRIGDPAGIRLATMHNLRFYSRLVDWLRG